jgi:hypothetical protein
MSLAFTYAPTISRFLFRGVFLIRFESDTVVGFSEENAFRYNEYMPMQIKTGAAIKMRRIILVSNN